MARQLTSRILDCGMLFWRFSGVGILSSICMRNLHTYALKDGKGSETSERPLPTKGVLYPGQSKR